MSDAILHVDNDTPTATADSIKTMFKGAPTVDHHAQQQAEQSALGSLAGAEPGDRAEHTRLELDAVTVGLLAASDAIMQARETISAKLASLRPHSERHASLRSIGSAIRCMLAPYTSKDLAVAARRLIVPTAALTAALAVRAAARKR